MNARFPHPVRTTRVREFSSRSKLEAALGNHMVVFDGGVPGISPEGHLVAGGEDSKRWSELEKILAWLAEAQAERSSTLVVVGGGATLDLGALAASLYRRGMSLVLVPTTLLGMVDATLGGKTAVDFTGADGLLQKNFAGTFYPAAEVWICSDFLRTLPVRERVSGAGEVFKTMRIRGKAWHCAALFDFVRSGEVTPALGKIVMECLAVKAKLVERDPLDSKRIRELLNFGHTVGHALESASELSHGECVLWGMAVESRFVSRTMAAECMEVQRALGLSIPKEFSSLSENEWIRLLGGDKKTKGGLIELSLLKAPGRPVKKRISPAAIAKAIRSFPGA